MSLLTVKFALFVTVFLLVYYIVPKKDQWKCILIANIVFLWIAGPLSLACVLVEAVITYLAGRSIGRQNERYREEKRKLDRSSVDYKKRGKVLKEKKQRKVLVYTFSGIFLVVLLWLCSKAEIISWFTPVAISYYTFIAVSYVAGLQQGKYEPETNFFRYLTFLSYFPQLTEGPFNRYDDMKDRLFSEHRLLCRNVTDGVLRMLYGYVKKMVLADSLLLLIDNLYGQSEKNGYAVILLILLLPMQQYSDFSGCMDIVLGLSSMLGISMKENFRSPIFSKSIDEVWRRWHITLGAFCKDYIFYPVALNKKLNAVSKKLARKHSKAGKMLPVLCSLACVWTFMGIWHGFAWKYLIWGWMNLFFIGSSLLLEDQYITIKNRLHINGKGKAWSLFCIVRTYLLFGLMEFVADGNSAGSALHGIAGLLAAVWKFEPVRLCIQEVSAEISMVAVLGIILLTLVVDILKEKKQSVYMIFHRQPFGIKAMLVLMLFYCIILFAPGGIDINAGFAYAVF